jgi:hypothetical protein
LIIGILLNKKAPACRHGQAQAWDVANCLDNAGYFARFRSIALEQRCRWRVTSPLDRSPTDHLALETAMKGIALWMIGIPIPIIILLYLFGYM